jgi:hypothetical protein
MCLSWFQKKKKAKKKRSAGNVRRKDHPGKLTPVSQVGRAMRSSRGGDKVQVENCYDTEFSVEIEDGEADTGTVRENQPVHEQSWGSVGDSCSPVSDGGSCDSSSCGCDCGE